MPYSIAREHLAAIAGISTPLMPDLVKWINEICPGYEIDTPQEYCHFLAQACHETDCFKTLQEYASGKAYEGRLDLGNTRPGDGAKFKGRGVFQTTGRANYLQLGIKKIVGICSSIIRSCWSNGMDERKKFYEIARKALV